MDGEFPVEIGLNPIETDEGTIVLSAIVDITARKAAEQALRESEQRYSAGERRFRLVVEAAPNAMVMLDRTGKIVMVNAQTERVFGYSRGELVGQPVEMLVPERFRSRHPELRKTFYADPRPRPMGAGRDLYGLKKDGGEFPVEIGLNPIETDEGTMVLAAIVDITARKTAAQALRESEQRYSMLIDGVTDYAIYMVDLERLRHQLEPGRAAHQGLPHRGDRRPAFLVLLHRGGPCCECPAACARNRRPRWPVRVANLARAQGWQPLPGRRGDRRAQG